MIKGLLSWDRRPYGTLQLFAFGICLYRMGGAVQQMLPDNKFYLTAGTGGRAYVHPIFRTIVKLQTFIHILKSYTA